LKGVTNPEADIQTLGEEITVDLSDEIFGLEPRAVTFCTAW
jgi:hypothetical protein